MASNLQSYDSSDEEDYIDMDLFSSPHSTEFEFQMCFISNDENSPADELFYKGKLLPLHLSPRLKMLQTSNTPSTTPVDESCNISPSESCRDSCELNLDDDYFFEWSTELSSFIHSNRSKKSWSKKLKFVKNSIPIGHKLKACLKSLFSKSDESSCAKAAACNRSSSATEIDVSIDAAIAHCKKSQLLFDSRSTSGFSSFPGIPAAKNQQRPDKVGSMHLQMLESEHSGTDIWTSLKNVEMGMRKATMFNQIRRSTNTWSTDVNKSK
ncbi:putative membrane-associated kinase regulator 3 [Forsythia ovata]|uniref:Membrane-associated kinase regulator 3 n=1 Tax=Forsythia ovata TaxID=205694 RepID=A0ABD1TAA4_9LAMI